MPKENITLKQRWKLFFEILGDPWILLLLITLIIIFFIQFNNQDANLNVFYTVILAVLASVWGGIVSNRWIKITEEQTIQARGKGAVQSLNLLLSAITNLEERIKRFKGCCDEPSPNLPVLKTNYEEIEESLKILKQIGYNSIENWQDIVPEADLKNHFIQLQEILSKLKIEQEKVSHLQKELTEAKEEPTTVIKLEKEIQIKNLEILNLQSELVNCQMNSPSGSNYSYYEDSIYCQCPHCHCNYNPRNACYDPRGSQICPNCNKPIT